MVGTKWLWVDGIPNCGFVLRPINACVNQRTVDTILILIHTTTVLGT